MTQISQIILEISHQLVNFSKLRQLLSILKLIKFVDVDVKEVRNLSCRDQLLTLNNKAKTIKSWNPFFWNLLKRTMMILKLSPKNSHLIRRMRINYPTSKWMKKTIQITLSLHSNQSYKKPNKICHEPREGELKKTILMTESNAL